MKGKGTIQVSLVLCSDSSLKCEYHIRSAKELHVVQLEYYILKAHTHDLRGWDDRTFVVAPNNGLLKYTICESKGKVQPVISNSLDLHEIIQPFLKTFFFGDC